MQIKQAQDQQKQRQKQAEAEAEAAEAGANLNLSLSLSNQIFQVDWNHRSKKTAAKYKTNLNHFLNFIRIHDLDVLLDLEKEAIQELVIRYVLSMRDNPTKRYSRGTVNNRVSAILYFLDNNDIELNKRKIKRFYPSDETTNDDRPYTVEEIQRILSVCDLRTKAMIHLMASSGVRIGALSYMQISHITEISKYHVYKIVVYANSPKDRYYTFCTTECTKVINEYLEYRKRCGEDPLLNKSPLFRQHFNKQDPFTINIPKFLADKSIEKAIDEVLKKSGVKTKEAMRSHAFRKGFKSICEQSGMKSINVEMLLGHDIGVSGHYYRPAESDILEDYMIHAADVLTIDPTQRLKQENADLRMRQNAESDALWKKQKEQEARIKILEDWLRTAGLMDSCD